MWNVAPKFLCTQHLLGEHVEMHMFVGCINKNISIKGYIDRGLVEVHSIKQRHSDLATEMKKRVFNHASELPSFQEIIAGHVNVSESEDELKWRCKRCYRS
jgi:hypothetical protein